jgi:hypothetical protein
MAMAMARRLLTKNRIRLGKRVTANTAPLLGRCGTRHVTRIHGQNKRQIADAICLSNRNKTVALRDRTAQRAAWFGGYDAD